MFSRRLLYNIDFRLLCRYEREETFMALNLGVTSCQSLEISLDQFVRGEVLDGSNAYYCEKCKEKVKSDVFSFMKNCKEIRLYIVLTQSVLQRTTVKRTCIKSLPSVLVIHLMRFGFDWESGRSIKYDEQIRVRLCISISSALVHLMYSSVDLQPLTKNLTFDPFSVSC